MALPEIHETEPLAPVKCGPVNRAALERIAKFDTDCKRAGYQPMQEITGLLHQLQGEASAMIDDARRVLASEESTATDRREARESLKDGMRTLQWCLDYNKNLLRHSYPFVPAPLAAPDGGTVPEGEVARSGAQILVVAPPFATPPKDAVDVRSEAR